jgi:hypothetical protein
MIVSEIACFRQSWPQRCLIRRMKRLVRVLRWLLVVFVVAVLIVVVIHVALRPNPDAANAEQYAVLSAYIEPGLTGFSHDLGSRKGLVVIAARTTFSQPIRNSNKFKQYTSLVLSTGHAKSTIHQLSRSLLLEFWATNLSDVTLESKFQLPTRYELATEGEMNLYPYEAFFRRFPGSYGALTFSRVAFSRDLTEAFFYTEHLCGHAQQILHDRLTSFAN